MEVSDFINNCKDKHLRISDVKQLQIGDNLDVVIWDRNYEEYWIWDNAKQNQHYDPQTFFKANRCTLKYLGDMKWNITMGWGETFEHPVHLDLSNTPKTNWNWMPINFDERAYEPTNDGKVHITTEIGEKGDDWTEQHIHWTEFPDDTRVGWRGPIMRWSDLESQPNVYWNEESL